MKNEMKKGKKREIVLIFYNSFLKQWQIFYSWNHSIIVKLTRFVSGMEISVVSRYQPEPPKLLDHCLKHYTKIYKVSRYQPERLQNFQISVQSTARRSAKFPDINPSAFKTFRATSTAL